jgi:hypothetical protein
MNTLRNVRIRFWIALGVSVWVWSLFGLYQYVTFQGKWNLYASYLFVNGGMSGFLVLYPRLRKVAMFRRYTESQRKTDV